ncbi:MAG TPA: glycosyltransferase [Flavobacteriaceae bacterium]|nr:glycosyltransferase [Flavobacteriaceae bacterium]
MKSTPNIAFFTYALDFGGTERVVSLLANEMSNYFNTTIFVFYKHIDFPINDSINIVSLSNDNETYKNSIISKAIDYKKFIFGYKKALIEHNIDVSISFLALPNVINGFTKKRYPKIKTIISERCFPSKMYRGFVAKNLRKILFKKYYNLNDVLFSNSEHINEDLRQNFHLKINAEVIYNPIDFDEVDYAFTPYNSIDSFNVISVGRLIDVKNHLGTIEAIKLLNGSTNLKVFGNGPLREELQKHIEKQGLENKIVLHESIGNIKAELTKYHCFVLNSLTEGFPNALLEAMSVGLPVLATTCMSGPLELLNDNEPVEIQQGDFYKAKYGLLINVNDSVGLSKAIAFYKEHEKERETYSKSGFERAKHYDVKNIGNQLKQLIESL